MGKASASLQVSARVSASVKEGGKRIKTGVSLVLPMYNEADSVDYTLSQALAGLAEKFADFEVIVADDGSTDGCAAKVRCWAERDPHVILVRNARNQRFGGALRLGLARASKEVVIYTDFDLPVALEFLPEALQTLKHADVVTGYSSEQAKNLSRGSRLLSRGYNLLVHAFFRLPIRDVNFGFKAMHGSVCRKLRLVSRSPFVDAELFLQARRMGCMVKEIPVPFERRQHGISRIRRADVIAVTFLDMVVCFAAALFLPRNRAPLEMGFTRADWHPYP